MSLTEDLRTQVSQIFRDQWETRNGTVVPDTERLPFGNEGIILDATVLYADIDGSTALVDRKKATFAAEVYKTFLHCAAKIIRAEDGEVTAYDGDRIMGVFVGDAKNSSATRAALKINYAAKAIINTEVKKVYPSTDFELRHTVGVDTSKLLVARTGVRGANDLVWVGRAANYAAKLTERNSAYSSRITEEVFNRLNSSAKSSVLWEKLVWEDMDDMIIYRSKSWLEL